MLSLMPVNRHYIEYKWLAKGQKIPVLKITSDVSGLIVTYTDSIREYEAVDEKFIKNATVKLYPNPASTHIFIEFEVIEPVDVELALLDISGKCIFRRSEAHLMKGISHSKIYLKDRAIPNGTYLLFIRTAGQTLTRKLVISN